MRYTALPSGVIQANNADLGNLSCEYQASSKDEGLFLICIFGDVHCLLMYNFLQEWSVL